ncbi:hypothetical protein JHK82_015869 [Glycine max]|nr:hypothetical protein JHK85_016273 [Glycine max]KAG5148988.1 hypothetical protein JHK82_015869 [Glycine max]
MMFLRLLSSASKQNLWAIGASSHIINFVTFKSSANSLPWSILQIESSKVGTGILNLECAVRPLGNNNDAIPLEATVKTIWR